MKELTSWWKRSLTMTYTLGECPLCRFETTGQLVHPAASPNQVGHGCTWKRSLLEPTLRPPKKFQHLTRSEEVLITWLRIAQTKATISCPDDHRPFVVIVVRYWPLTICSWSMQCYRRGVTNTTHLTHWMLSLRQSLRLAQWNFCEKPDSSIWYQWSGIIYSPSLE